MQDKTAVKKQRAFNDCVYKARKYTGKKCCTSNKCTSIQAEQANTDCATRLSQCYITLRNQDKNDKLFV